MAASRRSTSPGPTKTRWRNSIASRISCLVILFLSRVAPPWLTQGQPEQGAPQTGDDAEEDERHRVRHYHISADASFFGASTLAA